jgi:hypothetical protein
LETLGTTQSRKLDNPEDLTSISPSARILGISLPFLDMKKKKQDVTITLDMTS